MNSVTMLVEKACRAQPLSRSRPDLDLPVAACVSNEHATAAPTARIEAKVADSAPILVLSLCLVFTVAIVVGLVAGIVSRIDAATPAKAVLRGGAAFGTALLIGIAVIALL